jgi:hypothetical protein
MKIAATIVSIWVMLLILGTACSREDQSPPEGEATAVRKTIQKPVRQEAVSATVPQEYEPAPAGETDPVEIAATIEEKKPEKVIENTKVEENGYYVTKRGDSLSGIAGREDVYGDDLKWPVIYRLNMEKLNDIEKDEDFPDRELPEGIEFKILTRDEIRENLEERPENYWVINVISSPEKEMLVSHVIELIMNGYGAYITRTEIDGKDWMRLRVGFFEQREDAETEGRKIMDILNFSDVWTTKVGDIERGEFGGY